MKKAVKPNGRIVVALVLPYRPFDEFSKFYSQRDFKETAIQFDRLNLEIKVVISTANGEENCWKKK
jgi:hypothetical protein